MAPKPPAAVVKAPTKPPVSWTDGKKQTNAANPVGKEESAMPNAKKTDAPSNDKDRATTNASSASAEPDATKHGNEKGKPESSHATASTNTATAVAATAKCTNCKNTFPKGDMKIVCRGKNGNTDTCRCEDCHNGKSRIFTCLEGSAWMKESWSKMSNADKNGIISGVQGMFCEDLAKHMTESLDVVKKKTATDDFTAGCDK